jgi:hypothetical protein
VGKSSVVGILFNEEKTGGKRMDNVTMEQEQQIQAYMEKYDVSAKYAKRFIAMEERGVTTKWSKQLNSGKSPSNACGLKYKPFNFWTLFF